MLLIVIGGAIAAGPARAIKLGNIIVGGAMALGAEEFAGPINNAINTITFNQGVPNTAATKVVPVISFGSGTRLGLVQVSGPADAVDQTKAVIQIETKLSIRSLDVEIFVPSTSDNPLKFSRAQGVGVSALVDYKL